MMIKSFMILFLKKDNLGNKFHEDFIENHLKKFTHQGNF